MTTNPVLSAMRALFKFKDSVTIAEIAKMSGVSQRRVLDVVNDNGAMVWRDRKSGRITKVDPQGVLKAKLELEGTFFVAHDLSDNQDPRVSRGGYLAFKGHEQLRARLKQRIALTYGHMEEVPDTPENRAALVNAGCFPWDTINLDDRLWKESA